MAAPVGQRSEVLAGPFLDEDFRADLALLVEGQRERPAASPTTPSCWSDSPSACRVSLETSAAVRRGPRSSARWPWPAAAPTARPPPTSPWPSGWSRCSPGRSTCSAPVTCPVLRARALVEATYGCADSTARRIDSEVSDRACRLTPSRVRDAVGRVLLREEADAVAARAAAATAARQVRRSPLADDQAEIALTGPAVPLAQAFEALDAAARALRAQGDGRGLDALRFDLATSRLCGDALPSPAPCTHAQPAARRPHPRRPHPRHPHPPRPHPPRRHPRRRHPPHRHPRRPPRSTRPLAPRPGQLAPRP